MPSLSPAAHITPKKLEQTNLDQWTGTFPTTNETRMAQSAQPPDSISFPSPKAQSERMKAEIVLLNQEVDSRKKQIAALEGIVDVADY